MGQAGDLKIEKNGAVLYFKFLPWDSEFFARDSFMLLPEKSKIIPSPALATALKERLKNTFVAAKIDTANQKEVLNFLYSAGFRYIDTEVVLKYDRARRSTQKSGKQKEPASLSKVRIERLSKNQRLPYADLVSGFNFSRFHQDTQIAKEKADLVWINYLRNYRPSRVNHMFVARVNRDVAGIILANQNLSQACVVLFFVALIKEFIGRGIGTKLIQYTVSQFANQDLELLTETQINNTRAMNFYKRNNFSTVKSVRTVLHRWG